MLKLYLDKEKKTIVVDTHIQTKYSDCNRDCIMKHFTIVTSIYH